MIEAVIFDLDETLHSREDAFWRWIDDESRHARDARLDRAQIGRLDARGRGDKRVLLAYLDQLFGWALSEAARMERFRTGIVDHIELDARVRDMLDRLKGCYRLGLVTNGTSETQRRKLQKLRLEDAFDSITISEEIGFKKPDPRAFQHSLQGLGTNPTAAVFVGDDPVSDITGARALGMMAVQVGGDGPLSNVLELEEWLDGVRRAPA
jgi:putative hydrolase of the HAD superfamily